MRTCRECQFRQEFAGYNPEADPRLHQNLYCTKHDTVEPAWGFTRTQQGREVFGRTPAPDCFTLRQDSTKGAGRARPTRKPTLVNQPVVVRRRRS